MSVDTSADEAQVEDTRFPREYDPNGDVVVKFTRNRTGERFEVTMGDLNGAESLKADAMVGALLSSNVLIKTYTLFGIKSVVVNGQIKPLPPSKNDAEIRNRAAMFMNRELVTLMAVYAEEYLSAPPEQDLKN